MQIALPLLGATPATDGMSTTLDVTVDVARHVMLLDHALANQNELTPPGMSPLPLVPFAVSMEYMAEVAATLRPGWFVRRLEKLRSYRWLALDAGTLPPGAFRRAVHGADARRRHHRGAGVHACGRRTRAGRGGRRADGGHAAGDTQPVYTLQAQCRGAMPVPPFAEFYARYLFHGTSRFRFHPLRTSWPTTASKSLEWPSIRSSGTRPTRPCAVTCYRWSFWTVWASRRPTFSTNAQALCALPLQIESFEQFSPQLARAQQIRARSHAGFKEAICHPPRWNFWTTRDTCSGVTNFRQRYFDDPQVAQFIAPQTPEFFHSAELTRVHRRSLRGITTGFSSELFSTSDGIWLRALRAVVLAPADSATWHRAAYRAAARMHWLLGRVAAKDAVRRWAQATHGLALMPWDIAITNAASGQPSYVPLAQLSPLPDLAISQPRPRCMRILSCRAGWASTWSLPRAATKRCWRPS
ncbi:MAG: hypothetical protein R2851_02585 [Caldilineaceae bacterium]